MLYSPFVKYVGPENQKNAFIFDDMAQTLRACMLGFIRYGRWHPGMACRNSHLLVVVVVAFVWRLWYIPQPSCMHILKKKKTLLPWNKLQAGMQQGTNQPKIDRSLFINKKLRTYVVPGRKKKSCNTEKWRQKDPPFPLSVSYAYISGLVRTHFRQLFLSPQAINWWWIGKY